MLVRVQKRVFGLEGGKHRESKALILKTEGLSERYKLMKRYPDFSHDGGNWA